MPDPTTPPAPPAGDRHFDVGDCRLHVWTGGSAGDLPAVVLEAGGGSALETWGLVAQQLALRLRVLSYERAGVGSSEGRGASSAEVSKRLSAVLDAAQIARPVVLAGHSLGGLYARCFAANRPGEVLGLVLIDSTPDHQPLPRIVPWLLPILSWGGHLAARSGLPRRLRRSGSGAAPAAMRAAQLKARARASHVRAVLAEIRALGRTQRDAAARPLPQSLPVLCITAGTRPGASKAGAAVMQSSHDRLAATAAKPWSRHHCIAGATHSSLLTDAEHAATVAGLILEFARHIAQRAPAGAA